jgi:hypothetical protein
MSLVPASDPKQQLITSIRGWMHMDNLVESFNRQATNARQLRTKHEDNSIGLMKQMGLTASTIQVSGASLQLKKSKAAEGLTWAYLEREIPAWACHLGPGDARACHGSTRLTAEQVASLLKWLHDRREVRETEYLKKTLDAPKAAAHLQ